MIANMTTHSMPIAPLTGMNVTAAHTTALMTTPVIPVDQSYGTQPKYNDIIFALADIQEQVSHDCRRAATLILSGFLVVGILLIIPAILQTAAAYLWIGQCRRQLRRQRSVSATYESVSSTVPHEFRRRNVTDMTRTLFIYRILACSASLLVFLCSTLPQLVLVVANPPREGNLDQMWGWCHAFVYLDHVTRAFATYLIVVPYVIFFWDFVFSDVLPRKHLVMKQIFRGVLLSAIPIALFSSIVAIPLVMFRYTKSLDGNATICSSTLDGTTNFLVFDFAVTRVGPTLIIIMVTASFLVWLPRDHYGVFYEPLIFLALMAPVVLLEAVIYIAFYIGTVEQLVNRYFSDVLLIFYAIYHMSFSSTFVLATLRSVITEIQQERRSRKRFLFEDPPEHEEPVHSRQGDVMRALQRQFSVVFRWRSECAEDELQLGENITGRAKKMGPTAIDAIPEENFDEEGSDVKKHKDDVTLHYSILQRSVTYKKTPTSAPNNQTVAKTAKKPTPTNSPTSSTKAVMRASSQRIRQPSESGSMSASSPPIGSVRRPRPPGTPRSQQGQSKEGGGGIYKSHDHALTTRNNQTTIGFEF